MFKGALLTLANQQPVYRFVMRHDLLRSVAWRYVAGESLEDAVAVAQTLNSQGLRVSLDHLGENVGDESGAQAATADYLRALDAISTDELDGNISIKLTQIGLDVSHELCVGNLRRLLQRARERGEIFVRLDMEGSAYTQRTLDAHETLWDEGYRNVGVVLQAYLYRTHSDVERLDDVGARVRLCKGAYLEPPEIAYPQKADVDANFARLTEQLLLDGEYPAIATHDERLIEQAQDVARKNRIPPERFEFQMLFGVRRDLQLALRRQGYNVRVYVPYGLAWYPYLVRRLAERPANMAFLVRSTLREALTPSHSGLTN